jgi:GntR family transcriptional regulator
VRIEHGPPKYAVIVNALKSRIEDGTYPPGSMLPSESALLQEFDTSRVTVVRALQLLFNDGWIDSEKGKGRFVRESRPEELRPFPAHAAALLTDEVEGRVRIIDVAEAPAPNRAVVALDLPEESRVVIRRRLVVVDGVGPVELGTAYIPLKLAEGTGVRSLELLPDGLLRHLSRRKGIQFDRATERISTRPVTEDESRLLEIASDEWVLTAMFTVYDRTGAPAFALDIAVPPGRHEFEDSFSIT